MAGIADVYHACRVSDTVFAMNPYLTQQNFYSQQLRALALVTAIEAVHLPPGRRNVSIVGAGVAGRTLAAAFVCVGASVTLIDKRHTPFEQYRNAGHRELHPNIIFWPNQRPTPVTALPFLNWAQASADVVVKGMLTEWNAGFAHKVCQIEGGVVGLSHSADGVTLEIDGGPSIQSDLCVIATGFRRERGFGALGSPSYWSPTAVCDEGDMILVSGSGDGGLIDVLSPILGTRVTKAAHMLAIAIGDTPLMRDVAAVEKARSTKRRPGTGDSDDPCSFYSKVRMSTEVAASIDDLAASRQQLKGRAVTLLYEGTSPYSYTAAPINKLLLAHFSNGMNGVVKTTRGRLRQIDTAHVMQSDDGTDKCIDPPRFDRIMIRHGAEPALTALLSGPEIKQLVRQAEEHPEAARITGYDRQLFRWTARGIGGSGVTLAPMRSMVKRALNQLGQAYDLDIVVGRIKDESFTGAAPIEVELAAEGRKRARQLKLFPIDLGPAKVIVKSRATRRNAPYAIDA